MNYSKEFKEEALKLSDEIGVKKAVAQLGLHYYTIADWRKNRKAQRLKQIPPLSEAEMKTRNAELERENAELRRANDILKDALVFICIRPEEVKTSESGYYRGAVQRWETIHFACS